MTDLIIQQTDLSGIIGRDAKITAMVTELARRRLEYGQAVAAGQMHPFDADHGIRIVESLITDLRAAPPDEGPAMEVCRELAALSEVLPMSDEQIDALAVRVSRAKEIVRPT